MMTPGKAAVLLAIVPVAQLGRAPAGKRVVQRVEALSALS